MERFLWVCLGGAAGSGARYLLSGWVGERLGAGFPWGTLSVNLVGSFALGALMEFAQTATWVSPTAQLALTVGVLGGFTTYSTFNYETLANLQQGAWGLAATNVGATVVGCLAAGFLGLVSARAVTGA
jgi:CrcB protein